MLSEFCRSIDSGIIQRFPDERITRFFGQKWPGGNRAETDTGRSAGIAIERHARAYANHRDIHLVPRDKTLVAVSRPLRGGNPEGHQ